MTLNGLSLSIRCFDPLRLYPVCNQIIIGGLPQSSHGGYAGNIQLVAVQVPCAVVRLLRAFTTIAVSPVYVRTVSDSEFPSVCLC